MARPVLARVAVEAGWVEVHCSWCGRFPVLIPENEADMRAFCSTYCIRQRALDDAQQERQEGRDDERRLPVHVKHPEMMRYLTVAQEERPSYLAWAQIPLPMKPREGEE